LILKKGEPFCIFYRRNKKYFLVESGKDLDDFKEEICDLILNNKKVVIEHHELNRSGFLYEVRVSLQP